MKKFAIGCGVVALVVLVGVAVVGYLFVYRPAQGYIASFRQLGEIADLEKTVSNKSSFTAPENGELTGDMVARFVKVQESMQAKLGPRFAELKTKYDAFDRAQKAENRQPTLAEAVTALKDLAGIVVDGKRAQVAALNETGFSLEEYSWVRQQVYAAAGLALAQMDLRDIANAAQSGEREIPVEKTEAGDVPERNRELVKPYADKLREWLAFGFFGL